MTSVVKFGIGPYTKARRRGLSSLLCLWTLLFLSGCGQRDSLEAVAFAGSTMGTTYNVTVVVPAGGSVPENLDQQIEGWLADVNQSMSTYIDDSELMELNRAPTDQWLPVSGMLAEVLVEAQRISELSDGAFDITVGPLVDLWGFGPVARGDEIPSQDAVQEVQSRVGFQHLTIQSEPPAVRKDVAVRMDLSAIAKGFGADYVGRQLAGLGLVNYLVEIGGDLAVNGYNYKGSPWRIGVEKPSFNRQGVQERVAVSSGGMATSGDYRNFYERDGQIYTHIVDPRLGRPMKTTLMSVTVIAESAARADGLATAMTVMGADEALAMAERESIAAYFIVRAESGLIVRQTSAFSEYVLSDAGR